jgi:hypothetical protein
MNKLAVIQTRKVLHGNPVDHSLCLTNGDSKRYRLFTSADGGKTEVDDDVIGCEFDSTSDVGLSIFLTESFWRLEVSRQDIDREIQRF